MDSPTQKSTPTPGAAKSQSSPPVKAPASYPQAPRRELEAQARRILIVGLDGATFDVLNPLMEDGRMPNLRRLVETGASGILESTKPPITPAAWTTFMTGKGPGRHGIVDFEKYDVSTNTLTFNSTYEIREKTIWEILSEKGFKVGSINLPMTYPPRRVNGFMISGFETPSTEAEFTYPNSLKEEILKRWPDYSYRSDWKRRTFGGDALFQRNLDYISGSFLQGREIATYCGETYGWDVLMVLYKLVDNLQHKTWKYLDPMLKGRYPKRAEMIAGCFEALDREIGALADYARQHDALILVMSDHGHGSLDGKAQPNALLKQWGYLALKSGSAQARLRVQRIAERVLGHKTRRFAANQGIEHDLVLDWSRTQACVMHAGMYGFLYVSLKGRQPDGVVEPSDYERLRDELRERFLSVTARHPDGYGIHVFPEVHRTEELYNCKREEQPWLPDLLLVPHPGLAVVRKVRGSSAVRWSAVSRREGTHRVEGVLVANGPGIRQGHRVDGELADIAPTLLASLGLRVPADMEGRALAELFERPLVIETEPPQEIEATEYEEVYSDEDKEALTRRLSDLGYLE